MILIKEKPLPDYYAIKEDTKFAILPTRLKRTESDYTGSVIWLEKYVQTSQYKSSPKMNMPKHKWHVLLKETPSQFTLRKLSEDDSQKKEKYEGDNLPIQNGQMQSIRSTNIIPLLKVKKSNSIR
jgi:hypothetical protein